MAFDYLNLVDELVPAEKAYERYKEEEQALLAKISSLDAEREKERILLTGRSEELAESRSLAVEVEGSLKRLENQVEMLGSRLEELDQEDSRRAAEISDLEAEATALENERIGLTSTLEMLTEQSDLARREYDISVAELAAVRENLREFERALEEARRAHGEESERLSAKRQQIASVESRREGLAESIGKMDDEVEAIKRQIGSAQVEMDDAKSLVDSRTAAEGLAIKELEQATSAYARASESLARHEESESEMKESLVEAKSSLSALEDFLEFGESRFADAETFRSCGAQVLASFSEMIRVDPKFEKAIETALGDQLRGVVVKTPGEAVDAIRALMSSQAGRGVALPIEVGDQSSAVVPLGKGILGAAADFVRCDANYRSLVQSLLGNVVLVENIDAAQAAWCNGPQGVVCVTLDGEIIHANGVAEGGLTRNEGLLERSRRCEEMRSKAENLEKRLLALSPVSKKLNEQLKAAEQKSRGAAEANQRAEVMRVEAEGTLRSAEDKREELTQRRTALESNQEQTRTEQIRLAEVCRVAKEGSLRSEEAIGELVSRIHDLEKKVSDASRRYTEVEARVTDKKVALTQINGQVTGLRAEVQRIRDGVSQNSARKIRREEEQRESGEKKKQYQESLAQSKENILTLQEEKAKVAAEEAERERVVREMQTRDQELGDSIRETKELASALNDEVSQAAERRTRLRTQRESLVETAEAEYQIDLEETAESLREELPKYQEIVNRLEMLNQRLARIGEVNPLAAQEYDEINQEYIFLQEQQQDLGKLHRRSPHHHREIEQDDKIPLPGGVRGGG